MFCSTLYWIRRPAQGEARPLPGPSIGTRGALERASTDSPRDFTSARTFHHGDTEHTETEHRKGWTARRLRPGGAQGCRHGWSAARVLAGEAQPVESEKRIGPPRQGRRKIETTSARRSRAEPPVHWTFDPLMPERAAALSGTSPAEGKDPLAACRAFRLP